jgi:hypothetical protein
MSLYKGILQNCCLVRACPNSRAFFIYSVVIKCFVVCVLLLVTMAALWWVADLKRISFDVWLDNLSEAFFGTV